VHFIKSWHFGESHLSSIPSRNACRSQQNHLHLCHRYTPPKKPNLLLFPPHLAQIITLADFHYTNFHMALYIHTPRKLYPRKTNPASSGRATFLQTTSVIHALRIHVSGQLCLDYLKDTWYSESNIRNSLCLPCETDTHDDHIRNAA